jgi:RimJ/RimL family protein N-acetyltransferase
MSIRIETERLILRPIAPDDVEPHCAMMAESSVAKFLTPAGKPRTRAEEWRAFATLLGHWQMRGFGFFSVFEKSGGAWAGRVGPWMPEGWPGLEAGWAIARPYWGKGYAPEAAIAAIRWTFNEFPDLDRIISIIDPANANSQAVARKIGETMSGEIFRFLDLRLDIWAAERGAWLREFG